MEDSMLQKIRLIFLTTIVALITVLRIQNWKAIDLQVFFWPNLPVVLSLLILFSFVLGFAFGWFGRIYFNFRQKRKAAPVSASDPTKVEAGSEPSEWESE